MEKGSRKSLRPRKKRLQIDTVTADNPASTSTAAGSNESDKSNIDAHVNQPEPEATAQIAASAGSPERSGASSPDPNCAICLGKLENKSFTDSCFHQFCFVCLVEWSKVKAECPLCKQSFKSIVHNVRTYDDYDQYHIPRPEDRNSLHHFATPGGARFRYRTTVTDHRYAHLADRIEQEIENRLLQRPSSRNPILNYRRLRQPAHSDFRRDIYNHHLKLVLPQMNTRRRVRETSPTFFRENSAQTHRLVPWLNRELNALLQGHGSQVAFVLDLIMGLIKRFAIDSEEFYQHVFPFTGRHTRSFMHEFLMFAKSPYHMAAYDRHITYETGDTPNHNSESDSDHQPVVADDGNDSDVIVVSPSNSPVSGVNNNPSAAPQRLIPLDPNLVPWERSILTAGNPSYLGFAPIVRSFGTEDLSVRIDQMRNSFHRVEPPLSVSGWDSPTPGPSSFFGGGAATVDRFADPSNSQSSDTSGQHQGSSSSIWTPSTSSISTPTTPLLPSASNLFDNHGINFFDLFSMVPRPPSQVTVPSTSHGNPIVCNESDTDSNASDLMIVDYEKPWTERSPIRLSSGEETDVDVMITRTEYATDCVKTEKKKKKHKHRHNDDERPENGSRDDAAVERPPKKRRHHTRSRSRSIPRSHKSRSRSLSPLQMRIIRAPNYKHKKFSYSSHTGNTAYKKYDIRRPSGLISSRRSSHRARSRSTMSCTDSDPESESKHVSIRSHKHKSKSRHSSIQIVEYRKRSSKYKKSKKHKKDKIGEESHSKDKHRKKHRHDKDKSDDHKRSKSGHSSSSSHSKTKKSKHRKDTNKQESVHEAGLPDNVGIVAATQRNSESSETDVDVAKQMAIIMKEIHEMEKGKAHEISDTVTSDSDPDSDSEIDVEHLSEAERDNTNTDTNKSSKNVNFTELNKDNIDNKEKRTKQISKNNDSDVADLDTSKATSDTDQQKTLFNPAFSTANLEFVELSNVQAFDEDLESLTQCLSEPRYASSFSTADVAKPKLFKKHPHGHKKSTKSAKVTTETAFSSANMADLSGSSRSIVATATAPNKHYGYEVAPDIQSNDVSSCTDLDIEQRLPSFLSFVEIPDYSSSKQLEGRFSQLDNLSTSKNTGTDYKDQPSEKKVKDIPQQAIIPFTVYEFPSSSGCLNSSGASSVGNNGTKKENDYVNVDTVSSDESDIDITGDEVSNMDKIADEVSNNISSYKTSKDSIKPTRMDECIDVVGVSDDDDDDCNVIFSAIPGCSGLNKRNKYDRIDVSDLSDTDSDAPVQYVGVEHGKVDMTGDSDSDDGAEYKKIDITGESDSDNDSITVGEEHKKINLTGESDEDDSDNEVDVLSDDGDDIDVIGDDDVDVIGHSDDEIIIDAAHDDDEVNGAINKISVDSESDSTDLDYHCDEYEFSTAQCSSPVIDILSPISENSGNNAGRDEVSFSAENEAGTDVSVENDTSKKEDIRRELQEETEESESDSHKDRCSDEENNANNDNTLEMTEDISIADSNNPLNDSENGEDNDEIMTALNNCVNNLQNVIETEQNFLAISHGSSSDNETCGSTGSDDGDEMTKRETSLGLSDRVEKSGNASEIEPGNIMSQSTSSQPDNQSTSSGVETPRLTWLFNPLLEPQSPSYIYHNLNTSGTMSDSSGGSSARNMSPQFMATLYEPEDDVWNPTYTPPTYGSSSPTPRSPSMWSPTYHASPSPRSPTYPPNSTDTEDSFIENFAPED